MAALVLAAVVLAVAAPAAFAQGSDGPSLFDAWWARVFCLWLLIPAAAFIRRLLAGWLNFLGFDEERWAGLSAGMLGGLAGLLVAGTQLAGAGSRGLGWALGSIPHLGGWLKEQKSGGGGGGPGVAEPPGTSSPGGPAGGASGPGAGPAQGGEVIAPDDVPGEGLRERGSPPPDDPEKARRQAVQQMLQDHRARRETYRDYRKWYALGAEVLADVGRAAGTALGTLVVGGSGSSWGREVVHAFADAGAAPARGLEMFFNSPPPRYPSVLDGARWR
jgi:hypothetical protein